MLCLAVDTRPNPTKWIGCVQEWWWNSRLTVLVLAASWNICFFFTSVHRKMTGYSMCGHSDRIHTFIQRHINFEAANERDGKRERQFQLVRVEAGGDSCQGDKSCEHEVWVLCQWFFFLYSSLLSSMYLNPSFEVVTSDVMFQHHLSSSSGKCRWGPCLFSKITIKVMASCVMCGGKYFWLSPKTSPSCSQLVSKCKDVLSAHATLSAHAHPHPHIL